MALDGLIKNGAFVMERIEYARRQALDAYERANACVDTASRDEWLKAAALWEAIGRQYELLLKVQQSAMVDAFPKSDGLAK